MSRPKVSVIIAALNGETWLKECLDSLQQQTYRDWEAVICDDASTDGTRLLLESIAHKDSRLRILKNERTLGPAVSRNRCLDTALGEYIAIQDADDISSSDRLEVSVDYLDHHPESSFVSSGMFLFDDQGIYTRRHPKRALPTRWSFLLSTAFFHASTMFRRECLTAIGGYRLARETRRGQDYDLFLRLYAAGFRGANLQPCLYGYRVNPEAMRRRKFKFRIDEMVIRYKGFRALKMFPWALPFVFKPLVAGALPLASIARMRRHFGRNLHARS